MSEETVVETPPDVETRARAMGWSPKESWRGDPEAWKDAATFLKHGEEVMPILRHNNRDLLEKNAQLQRQIDAEKAARSEIEKQVKELADFQAEEVARQVKERVKDLRRQIREAREAGDETREDLLLDELEEVRTRPAVKPAETKPAAPKAGEPDPAYLAWAAENPWFPEGPEQDPERAGLALGIAAKVRKESPLLTGKAFYNEIDKRLAKFYAGPPAPPKVEGGGEPSGGGGRGNGRAYSDLPADAKAQCSKDASRFVGPNKLYKTEKEWQAHYANLYFSSMEPRQ